MNKKLIGKLFLFNAFSLIFILFFSAHIVFAQVASKQKIENEKNPTAIPNIQESKDADTIFKEALKLRANDPMLAITFYKQGLMVKPEAWNERMQLAEIYEKQNQFAEAIAEYELINKKTGSKDSYIDLIRVMNKAGYLIEGANIAKKAFEKFPQDTEFLYLAGESLYKIEKYDEAKDFLSKYINSKPDDGKALFLIGSIYEKKGKLVEALNSYQRAKKFLKDSKYLDASLIRLQSKTMKINGVTLLIPEGWQVMGKGLISIDGTKQISMAVYTSSDPSSLALKSVKDVIPLGFLFDEINRKDAQLKKIDNTQQKENIISPELYVKDYEEIKGAKIAFATICKTCPGIGSAVSIAIPKQEGKTYLFTLKSDHAAEQGEQTLRAIIKNIL